MTFASSDMEAGSLYSSRPVKIAASICLCAAFACLGLLAAVVGPTLLDLRLQTQSSVREMSFVFTARTAGSFLGCIFGGELVDRLQNIYFTMAVALAVGGVVAFFVPFCTALGPLMGVMALQGFAFGVIDNGGNTLLLKFWHQEIGPWMQILHFSFGFGALIAPLVAEPFLLHSDTETDDDQLPISETPGPLAVRWAYYICGMLTTTVALSFLYWARYPVKAEPRPSENSAELVHRRQGDYRTYVLVGAFLFFLFYVGLEVGYGSFLFTYSVKSPEIAFSRSDGAFITAVYWGMFSVGRFLAIFLALKLEPLTMLMLDFAGCFLAMLMILIFHANASILWVGTGLFGFSMASVFPSGIHLIENFIDVTGRVSTILVVASSLGDVAVPLLLGWLIGVWPALFIVLSFIILVLAILIFAVLYKYASSRSAQYVLLDEAADVLTMTGELYSELICRQPHEQRFVISQRSKPPKSLSLRKGVLQLWKRTNFSAVMACGDTQTFGL
eukprot:m.65148 g.65148  ORF g.65148 m.65148 type:complete len:501 (+) comp49769_c0_seq6:79-1581(+)